MVGLYLSLYGVGSLEVFGAFTKEGKVLLKVEGPRDEHLNQSGSHIELMRTTHDMGEGPNPMTSRVVELTDGDTIQLARDLGRVGLQFGYGFSEHEIDLIFYEFLLCFGDENLPQCFADLVVCYEAETVLRSVWWW